MDKLSRSINLKQLEKKRSGPILLYYFLIHRDELGKTMKTSVNIIDALAEIRTSRI
jgi:hypothetical protein